MRLNRNPEPVASVIVTRERAGIALAFLMNGYLVGAWAPQIPEFAARLDLSQTSLGLLILAFGLGSLVMMPLAGHQIAKLGSARVTRFAAFFLSPALLGLTWVDNIPAAAIMMFLFGGLIGAMDVAMNANAVAVERAMRRSIMSSCHAFWSLGGLIGASIGGFAIEYLGVLQHAASASFVAACLVFIFWPLLLNDRPVVRVVASSRARFPISPLPWLLGLMALFCMIPEGAILDWGALYLRNELGASVSASGFAFASFSLAMAVMRFAGDLLRDRYGAVPVLRVCSVTAMIGVLMIGFAPSAPLAIAGFALTGIGISNIVPICFSAAGNLPGMAPGLALSVVTAMGYSGILVAPSAIGYVAEHTGLGSIFAALALLICIVLPLSPLARYADKVRP